MSKVLLVADISNLYFCTGNRLGGKVDYVKLREVASNNGEIYRAIAYGAQIGNQASPFISFLRNAGYETRYKEPQPQDDGTLKADWDITIALDVVRMIDLVDVVVIASADGDFAELVRWIQERGRKVVVIGCGIHNELKYEANEFIEMENRNELVIKKSSRQESVDIRNNVPSSDLHVTTT